VIVDNRWRGTPSTPATWELGEIYTQSPGTGLRSWTAPTTSWPVAGRDWYPDFRDYADEHLNSTILGLAYRLMVTGGLHPRAGVGGIPPIDVTPGLGDATVKTIYIRALQGTSISIDGDFMSIRRAVENAADAVIPTARATVEKAFDAVGIGYACAVPPGPPTLEVRDLLCNGKFVIRWPAVPGAIRYVAEVTPGAIRGPWPLLSSTGPK
jgi:Zn-dependent metalloprotease